jgi:rod shape determining protein RodA
MGRPRPTSSWTTHGLLLSPPKTMPAWPWLSLSNTAVTAEVLLLLLQKPSCPGFSTRRWAAMFDRRLISNFDWALFLASLLLSILGAVNLYSAGSFSLDNSATPFYLKQLYWLLAGLFLFLVIISIDYQIVARYAYLIHGASLLLLLLALVWGQTTAGTHRWLRFGGFSFQPSELAKISFVLLLSYSFSKSTPPRASQLQGFPLPTFFALITFLLVFLEPDLGTAALILVVFVSFIFFAKFDLRHIFLFLLSFLVLLPCSWLFLEDYQKSRLFAFLSPSKNSLHAGYQAVQSKIAIGSGMLFGKGFLCGTQSQLRFLPEQHTDFAFSVLAEEWGLAGSLLLISLLFLVVSKGLKTASQSRDVLGSFVSFGLVSILFWQISINIGMVIGLFPIVGIPLPFISYGGSSLVSTWAIVGMIMNVRMRRFMF